jgi:hypothetical protein
MKKLLAIIVMGLLFSGNAYAENKKWQCKNLSSKKSKCSISENDIYIEYEGEIKDDKPNGLGKWETRERDISEKGIFKNGKLVEGQRMTFGIKALVDNSEIYKIIYPDGANFVGKLLEENARSKIKGTMTFNNGTTFTGVLNTYINPVPIEGTTKYASGKEKGNIYIGSFYQLEKNHVPKKGKYIWAKQNDNNYESFEGNFKLVGNQSFMSSGLLKFRNGSKYEGTFDQNNKYLNGNLYTSTGELYKTVKEGKQSEVKYTKTVNIKKYFNLYNILGLTIIGSFLVHLTNNKHLYSVKKKFNLFVAIKSYTSSPIWGTITMIVFLIIAFKIFNWATPDDLTPGKPRFFGDVQ